MQQSLGDMMLYSSQKVDNFQKGFQDNFSNNSLFLIIAAAVCVGLATKTALEQLLHKTILPVVTLIIKKTISYIIYNKALRASINIPVLNKSLIALGDIFEIIAIWLLILYLTYIMFSKLININILSQQAQILGYVGKKISQEEQKKI